MTMWRFFHIITGLTWLAILVAFCATEWAPNALIIGAAFASSAVANFSAAAREV